MLVLSFCLLGSLVVGHTTAKPAADGIFHPILLFPGTSGSQIDAKLNKTEVVHSFCSKQSDWYNIWLNPTLYLPGIVDCFIDNFRLDFNEKTGRSQNRPGVEIRVPGFGKTGTIEYLGHIKIASAYLHNLVESLVRIGYKRELTLRGAPYDFRLAPNENPEYLSNVKALIEKMYSENGNKKVILIAHSMGARISYYFLLQQTDEWKKKYIRSWITLAATFGGETGTLEAISAGTYDGTTTLSQNQSLLLHRSFSSFLFVSPHAVAFNDTIIFRYKQLEYTAKDMPKILKLVGHTTGLKLWPAVDNLIPELKDPGVDVHCLRGTNTPTAETISYPDDASFPFKPEIFRGPGDGIVNKVSADACLRWSGRDNFQAKEFENVKHIDMAKDAKVLAYITEQVEKMNKD